MLMTMPLTLPLWRTIRRIPGIRTEEDEVIDKALAGDLNL